MGNSQTASSQQVATLAPSMRSQQLISSMLKLEVPELKTAGKMELMEITSQLMPGGKPNFREVIRYQKIADMVATEGKPKLHKLIFLMVKDFCNSLNIVRNMNSDQMVEAASMLLEESGNFRLEDYVMMFSMAKKGELVDIRDRVDIQMVTQILDAYYAKRSIAGSSAAVEEAKYLDGLGPVNRMKDGVHPQDAKLMGGSEGLAAALGDMKKQFKDWKDEENKPKP